MTAGQPEFVRVAHSSELFQLHSKRIGRQSKSDLTRRLALSAIQRESNRVTG